jgi:hypothetical protein
VLIMTMSLREAATRLVDSWDRDPQGPWPELGALREALAEAPAVALTATERQVMHRALRRSNTKIEAEKAEPAPTVQRESVTDALSIVKTYGPWGPDLNDSHRRQIVLVDEVLRLRHVYELAVRGRAEMREALRQEREAEKAEPTFEDPMVESAWKRFTAGLENPSPLTDEEILELWSPSLGGAVQRPILGRAKILAFARALLAAARGSK